MQMTYAHLSSNELHGTTQADYLVSLEGDLRLEDDDGTWAYTEPSFPVVELARSLRHWVDDPNRADFVFDSMSFEEVGVVAVTRADAGWVFSSVFDPGGASSPVDWAEAERCIRTFIARVEEDLRALGVDPEGVTRK